MARGRHPARRAEPHDAGTHGHGHRLHDVRGRSGDPARSTRCSWGPLHLRALLNVRDLDLALAAVYLPGDGPAEDRAGRLDAAFTITHDAKDGTTIDGDGVVQNVALRRPDVPGDAVTAPALRFMVRELHQRPDTIVLRYASLGRRPHRAGSHHRRRRGSSSSRTSPPRPAGSRPRRGGRSSRSTRTSPAAVRSTSDGHRQLVPAPRRPAREGSQHRAGDARPLPAAAGPPGRRRHRRRPGRRHPRRRARPHGGRRRDTRARHARRRGPYARRRRARAATGSTTRGRRPSASPSSRSAGPTLERARTARSG